MKRAEPWLALAGAALFALALLLPDYGPASRIPEPYDLPSCSLSATAMGGRGRGLAVVFHGLAANSRTMESFGRTLSGTGMSVVMVDWPGHGDSREPFSFGVLDDCAEQLVDRLARDDRLDPETTLVVGHSMGAAAALRLADRFPVHATIAISPAITALPRRMPSNLLVLNGGWDIPRLSRFAEELADAAGDARTSPEDFLQRRAFRHAVIPRATHGTLLHDRAAHAAVAGWVQSAIPEAPSRTFPAGPSVLYWSLGMFGLLLIFPRAATLVVAVAGARGRAEAAGATPLGGTLVRWAAAATLAALALRYWTPLEFIRLYDGDWMASFVFLAGVTLLFLLWRTPECVAALAMGAAADAGRAKAAAGRTEVRPYTGRHAGNTVRAVVAAGAAALAVALAAGAWLDWHLYDAWLNAPRWWRFAAVVPFLLPYFLAEEIALGAPTKEWRTEVRRYARFILLRAVLGGIVVAAVFLLGGALLAILLGPYIALGGVVVRLGADALRRRTGSAAAAAVFGAILAGWALAAALPLL